MADAGAWQSPAVARQKPGGRRRSVAHAVLDDSHDSSQLEELKAQNEAASNWRESLFDLGSGVFGILHGFLLPFRACFTSTTWGEYADRPALQYPELANYCVSLYLVDVAFLALLVTPLVREHVRRRAARSARPRSLIERIERPGDAAGSSGCADRGRCSPGTSYAARRGDEPGFSRVERYGLAPAAPVGLLVPGARSQGSSRPPGRQ